MTRSKPGLTAILVFALCICSLFRLQADTSRSSLEYVSHWGGQCLAVASSGTQVFAAQGPRLAVVDLSDPRAPTQIGVSEPLEGWIDDIAISGDHAVVVLQKGAMIVELNGTEPRVVAQLPTSGWPTSVDVDGDHAFVTKSWGGLAVVDMSKPALPVVVATAGSDHYLADVVVRNGTAYVASEAGLLLIDVSRPREPVMIVEFAEPGPVYSVEVAGDTAILGTWNDGLVLVDITDLDRLRVVGTYQASRDVRGIATDGDLIYVASQSAGLQVVDTADRSRPVLLGSYQVRDGFAEGLQVAYPYVYLAAGGQGMQVLDVSDPANIERLGLINNHSDSAAHGVTLHDGRLYVPDFNAGLQVVDVSDPTRPRYVERHDPPGCGTPMGITLDGDYAFAAFSSGGLVVFDATRSRGLVRQASCREEGLYKQVIIQNDMAFAVNQLVGLDVIDVSTPSGPSLVETYPVADGTSGMAMVDQTVVLATSHGSTLAKVLLLDVSDPRDIKLMGSYQSSRNNIYGIAVQEDTVFLTDEHGLTILNISDTATPSEIGSYNPGQSCRGVLPLGDRLLLASQSAHRIYLLDIADPAQPALLAEVVVPGAASISTDGNLVAVGTVVAGVYLLRLVDTP